MKITERTTPLAMRSHQGSAIARSHSLRMAGAWLLSNGHVQLLWNNFWRGFGGHGNEREVGGGAVMPRRGDIGEECGDTCTAPRRYEAVASRAGPTQDAHPLNRQATTCAPWAPEKTIAHNHTCLQAACGIGTPCDGKGKGNAPVVGVQCPQGLAA